MLILGLSSLYKNHAAAALVRDGVIVAALENYKLQPNAPWGIPEAAIQNCLSNGGVAWGDIDVVAIASDPFRGWRRRALSRRYLSPVAPVDTGYQQGKELSRIVKEWTGIRVLRQRMQDTRKVVSLDHHCCHAASAFFLSAFDEALILTLDGEGGHAALSSTPAGPDRDLREFISQTEFRNSTLKTINSARELVQHSVFNPDNRKFTGCCGGSAPHKR